MADNTKLASLCQSLIYLDYDAIEAYDSAISRIKEDEPKRQLGAFKADHERHVRDLSPFCRSYGKEPPKGPDVKRVLTQGRVVIASLMGDLPILKAMWSNEDTTNQKYEEAAKEQLPPDLRVVIERNLSDERRHRDWIIQKCKLIEGKTAAA